MKLLFLAHRIPYPPNKGDKIRSYHELVALVERGYEVHLLAFADEMRDLSYQVDLARLCASVSVLPLHPLAAKWRALARLAMKQPLSLGYFASRKMKSLVKRMIGEHDFDAIFVYSSTMAQYVPEALSSRTIVDLVDADSEKWRDYAQRDRPPKSWLYEIEWKRLRRYEHEVVARFAYALLATQREASVLDELDEFTRHARLRIITNGVDLDYYQPSHEMGHGTGLKTAIGTDEPPLSRLVFVGAMDYYANIDGTRWFVEEVLPLIRQQEPRTEFMIVGSNPTREVKKLGECKGVTVTGFVNDVRPHVHSAAACVIPLRIARGIQNKVLEAMAMGKAVVATPEAVAGLRVENGAQLLLARTPLEFAKAAIKTIREESLRNNLAIRARRFVEAEHDWKPSLKRLVELVESVALRQAANSGANPRAKARQGI